MKNEGTVAGAGAASARATSLEAARLVPLEELFEIAYGTSLELNRLTKSQLGVNFVSRTSKNNGVSAQVAVVDQVSPLMGNALTVALGGSVLETFYQQQPFYTGRDVAVLRPRITMSADQMLFYCAAIRANQYRYSYGRQANKSLRHLLVPAIESVPGWASDAAADVHQAMAHALEEFNQAFRVPRAALPADQAMAGGTAEFLPLGGLFDVSYGTSLELNRLQRSADGINFISRTSRNNGVSARVHPLAQVAPLEGGALTVALGGSVLETFYQRQPFYTGFHVAVLRPLRPLTPEELLFYCAAIRANQYRYSYGRQANKTLKSILVPAPECIPAWVCGSVERVCASVMEKLSLAPA